MKKLFLTAVVALSTLAASAQFMVLTTYDSDSTEGMEAVTNNMGFGVSATDDLTIGIVKAGEDNYNLFARYNLDFADGMFAVVETPTTGGTDEMTLGLGMSVNVWEGLHIEPSFNMMMGKNADGERDGDFRLGFAYRF